MIIFKNFAQQRLLFLGGLFLIAIWPTVVRAQILLQNGQEVLSSISAGATATFEFAVDDAAGTVIVSVGETGVDLVAEPVIQVFAPDETLVTLNGNGPSGAGVQFSPAQTGRYTAVVRDESNDEAMQFRIRVLVASEETTLIDDRDAAPANGQEIMSSFPLGTFAVFPFQVNAAGTVIVSVGETGVDLIAEPIIQVFAPDGSPATTIRTGANGVGVQFSPAQTGRYTAVVRDESNDEAMQFRIVATGISDFLDPLLGDVNVDGIVNFLDISPFISVLSDDVFQAEADTNEDGEVNFLDISPFIAILSSP